MFYQERIDETLRFGDVLRGYISVTPDLRGPILDHGDLRQGYNLEVKLPMFSVVLSPCCSIGGKMIALTPLIEVRNSFYHNPYFEEDLTRINRRMEPQQTVSPQVWESFPQEEKQKRLEEGYNYAFLELFIYEKNDLFPRYTVHRRQGNIGTNCYMIDFRNAFRLNCEKIKAPGHAPLDSKCLQLSVETRGELRDKIAYYYSRIPREDKVLED